MPALPLLRRQSINPWRALIALALSLVVVTIDNTVLNTALPSLARSLHATTTDLQWITDAYTLVFASLLILAGSLAMRFGLRRAMIAGLSIFAIGSAASGLVHTSGALIALRAVMGFGAAFVMPATLASVMTLFDDKQRPAAFSVWSASAGIGVAIGPVVGGALLTHFFWGSVFWINVPLVVIAIISQFLLVPNFPGGRVGHIDLVGAGLSIAGLAGLVDAVIEGPSRGWLTTTTIGETLVAIIVLLGFVLWELRSESPMVDVRLFVGRRFNVGAGALAVTFFALFGALFVLTQYLQLVHGYSPLRAGLGALPFAGAMMVTSGLSNVVVARLGARASVSLGLFLMAAGLGGLGLAHVTTPYFLIALAVGGIGAGMGFVMSPASEATVGAVPVAQAAAASSLNSVARELGGVFGIAVIGSIVNGSYHHNIDTSLSHLGVAANSLAYGASRDITSAHLIAAHLPSALAAPLVQVANSGFTSAMDLGVRIASLVALIGASAAWAMLPRKVMSETKVALEATGGAHEESFPRVLAPAVG